MHEQTFLLPGFALFTVLVLLALACNLPGSGSAAEQPPQAEPNAPPEPTRLPEVLPTAETAAEPPAGTPAFPYDPGEIYPASFSGFPEVPVRLPAQYSGGYSLPVDLNQVQISESLSLSQQQRQLLSQNGFVVAAPKPDGYQEFYHVYESVRYDYDVPVFATTDSVFHVYHLIFDKMLRDLERQYFMPDLEVLTTAMLPGEPGPVPQPERLHPGTAALRNLAFFGVAGRLLELPLDIPAEVASLVDAEVALINAEAGLNVSPIWAPADSGEKDLVEDYSQYIPRGHYTRSDEFKRYFKAMMWYGRLTYRLNSAFETRRPC